MKSKSAATKHDEFVRARRRLERLEVVPSIINYRKGLRTDDVRQQITAGKPLEVHVERVGDTEAFSSVFPAGTAPGPAVVEVRDLNEVLDEYATSQDMRRSNKVHAADARTPVQLDGRPVSEEAIAKQRRKVRDTVFGDAQALRGIRDGLPVIRPPAPSANGKISIEAQRRYLEETSAQDELLDLEAERLRTFRAARLAEASKQLPEFTKSKLAHVLKALPAAQRAEVERAITATPEIQENIFVISRPITTAAGKPSLSFITRKFDVEDGGRPDPKRLAREFGQQDQRGIRVASISELMADAKELLYERTVYGEGACAAFPRHARGLFCPPEDVGSTGKVGS